MRLVWIALGWAAGIILASSFDALIPLFWLALLGVTFFLAWMLRHTRYRFLAMALFMLAFGGYRYQFVPQTSDVAQYNNQLGATIQGMVIDEPDIRDDRTQLRVQADIVDIGIAAYETSGIVLVNAPRIIDVQYGDTVRVTGRITTPAEYDTFSYADYLAQRQVFTIMRDTAVDVVATGGGNRWYAQMLSLKARLQANIQQALPDPQAALLTGILLGNERGISPALQEAFARTGAAHIIAISGFNMAIIAGIFAGLAERSPQRLRWLFIITSIVVLGLYTLLVGANAAVVRATVMSSLLIIGEGLRRKTYVPASLAFVAIVMSFHRPTVLWDISFQLSFFAVLGLSLFTDPLSHRFQELLRSVFDANTTRRISKFLQEPLIVSLAALALTLPLTMLYFQRFSVVALLVNVLIVPVQSYLLIIGMFALLLSLVAFPLAQLLFWLDMVLLSWSIGVVRWFGDLAYADVILSVDSAFVWFVYISIIGVEMVNVTRPPLAMRTLNWLQRRRVFSTMILAGVALIVLLVAIVRSRPDGNLHIWWLDVGHTNAILIQSPNGAHMLVDGGRFPSRLSTQIGDRLPFYDRTIEVLAITQPDPFDTAAIAPLLNRYDAGVVLLNGQPNLSDEYNDLMAAVVPYKPVIARTGTTINLSDGVEIQALHPQITPDLADNQNDGVMVLRVVYGDVSVLLTGDLSIEGQQHIMQDGHLPPSTVMHLPQHGTARALDDAFLDLVQPQVIILQTDEANLRGDPDNATLAQLGEIPVWRTDEQGTIHLWTDGSTLWLRGEN